MTQAQFTVGSGNTRQVPDIANEGSSPLDPAQPKGISVQEIIQKFTAKEDEFKQARDHYTWREDVKYQTVDGISVVGEFRQVSDIVYDDRGRRLENVKFAPQTSLYITKEDIDDLRKQYHDLQTQDLSPPALPQTKARLVRSTWHGPATSTKWRSRTRCRSASRARGTCSTW